MGWGLGRSKKGAEEVLAKVKERKCSVPGWGGVGCGLGSSPGLEPGHSSSVSKQSSVLNDSVLLEVLLVGDSNC